MSNLLKELQKERAAILTKLHAIDNAIKVLQDSSIINGAITEIDGYDTNWDWDKKVVHALKSSNRFLKIKEIAEEILRAEFSKDDPETIIPSVRSALYSLRDLGSIVTYTPNKQLKNTVYGSPKWLDEKGEIIKGHEFQSTEKEILTID